ncbi:MAG: aspartyl/glutamyl-tRNA amidotransferase subunit C, partial [Dehalococcoidia bacterium]|nr:aspartyl/glutamyl-tRNA amidotransferase subunit C [Dehalococcoidia bacterium]
LHNIMRSDSVAPSLKRDDALSNAPEVEDGLIRVRAVLE